MIFKADSTVIHNPKPLERVGEVLINYWGLLNHTVYHIVEYSAILKRHVDNWVHFQTCRGYNQRRYSTLEQHSSNRGSNTTPV